MKVTEIIRRIPTEQYGYIEVKMVGEMTMEEVDELAQNIRTGELKRKYECAHFFKTTLTSKKGTQYETCPECNAKRFQNSDGNWGSWMWLSKED